MIGADMPQGFLACVGLLLAAVATAAEPAPQDKAQGALTAAEAYVAARQPGKAEPFVASALATAPADDAVRKRAAEILSRIASDQRQLTRARQSVWLAEAERLIAEGKGKEARELIHGKLETLEPELLARADDRLAAIHQHWFCARIAALRDGWLIDVVLALAILIGLAFLLWLFRRLVAWWHRDDWLVTSIDDATNLGLGPLAAERLTRWREEPPAGSAGLLKLDTLRVQAVPRIDRQAPKIDLSAALADLPSFGQVKLGAVAKAVEALWRQKDGKRPSISIAAYALGEQVVVRLTRNSRSGIIHTVAASGPKTVEGSAAAVDSASFKMYYLLANQALLPQVEAADMLRLGLEHLRRYIAGRDSEALQSAHETIRRVHAESPDFEEARLYEGIVLDLMERHDEAEGVFRLLAEHGHGEVKTKAIYNRAVTKFRKYVPKELELAGEILDGLIGAEVAADLSGSPPRLGRLATSPTKAMAVGAKANAIAHQPIFWETLIFSDFFRVHSQALERKMAAREFVFAWIEEVEHLTASLLTLNELALDEGGGWDPLTRKQLEWSSHNARGNVLLNVAIHFLREPHITGADEPALREEFLDRAYQEFEICTTLLPMGVETLTNMATTLLQLSRTSEARDYAEAARTINPDYEYAYYRLAQSWEQEGKEKEDEVRATLRSFKKPPKIQEFKKLFETYGVVPVKE